MVDNNFLASIRGGLFIITAAMWVNGVVRYIIFYRAWHRQYRDALGPIAVELLTPFNLLWRNFPPELASKRRKYIFSVFIFFVSLGLFFVSMLFSA